MRIAVFTDTFLPNVDGTVNSILGISKKLADRGHRVYIIAPKISGYKPFLYSNIMVKRCPSLPSFIYKGWNFSLPVNPPLLRFIIKEKVEIIHFHTPISLGMQAIVIAKMLNLPLIGTFNGFFTDRQYLKHAKMDHKLFEKIAWEISNLFYNRCDLVTCPSEGTKAELIAHGCRRNTKIIPYGVNLRMFDNSKSKVVKNAYNRKGKLLLFVGRIAYEKNIPYLLECFAPVLKKVPTTKLVIVGDGPQLDEIKAKIKALNIVENVILTGRIEHEKLAKSGIFGACDVFVNASTTETGPLTVLEAQANGLVCVGVKSRGMSLIKNNVNGYDVEPHDRRAFSDAIVNLLTDDTTYNRMKKATLRMVQKYDLSQIANEWEKTYESLRAKR